MIRKMIFFKKTPIYLFWLVGFTMQTLNLGNKMLSIWKWKSILQSSFLDLPVNLKINHFISAFHLINLDYVAILFNNGIYFAWELNFNFSKCLVYRRDGLKSTMGIKYICSNKFKCINKHAGYSAGLSELVSLWYSYIKTMVSSFQVTCNITSSIYSSGQWLLVKLL